jgi:hypothetical protein
MALFFGANQLLHTSYVRENRHNAAENMKCQLTQFSRLGD